MHARREASGNDQLAERTGDLLGGALTPELNGSFEARHMSLHRRESIDLRHRSSV
jgi:hypothetical protein